MGIYIKNMKAPVTCCHCPLMGYDPDIEWVDGGRETQGAYICVITHELIDNTKREDHCPLVPVPPHGRLIDADALAEHKFVSIQHVSIDGKNAGTAYRLGWNTAIEAIMENAKTIIGGE